MVMKVGLDLGLVLHGMKKRAGVVVGPDRHSTIIDECESVCESVTVRFMVARGVNS